MPDVPAVSGPAGLKAAVDLAFSERGALARVVEGYEPRDGQRRMAAAVAAVIEEGGTLLAEAGTGTGKTLAYLIPAILSRHRVLVSTGTKNLQEQIFFKDLPALRDALGVPFTATLMKGRSNYLCLHRWETYRDGVEGNTSAGGRLIDTSDRVLLPVIDSWARQTQTGDRAELRDVPEDLPVWKQIAADADTCLGAECPRYGDCFVTQMRQRAAEADVVIVNHHLLCADAAVRQSAYGEVIPSCPILVIDEGHQLEDVATQYFGVSFSTFKVEELLSDGQRLLNTARLDPELLEEIARALTRVSERGRLFASALSMPGAADGAGADTRARYTAESLTGQMEDALMLAGTLEGLAATLALAAKRQGNPAGGSVPELSTELEALQDRASELHRHLTFVLRADDADFVYFAERRGRGVALRAAPIDVSRIIPSQLLDRFRAVIFTSATLSVDGDFDYVRGRLGLRSAADLRVPSEFDYTRQALLYLPPRMPPPNAAGFAEAAARETIQILKRSRGRAFVLFTSYAMLRMVQRFVEMGIPYPVLVQGSAPRSVLLDRFRSTPHAVLLATSSFWQGVDVVGDALSCVIIDRLPFASPGEPVTAARIEAIRARGGRPFDEYQVPLAVLALKQGLGRLIRHRSDRGVLAILDPRLRTMGYGARFLASLPPAPVTQDLDAVGRFFM